jgi:hypothetical protein
MSGFLRTHTRRARARTHTHQVHEEELLACRNDIESFFKDLKRIMYSLTRCSRHISFPSLSCLLCGGRGVQPTGPRCAAPMRHAFGVVPCTARRRR